MTNHVAAFTQFGYVSGDSPKYISFIITNLLYNPMDFSTLFQDIVYLSLGLKDVRVFRRPCTILTVLNVITGIISSLGRGSLKMVVYREDVK